MSNQRCPENHQSRPLHKYLPAAKVWEQKAALNLLDHHAAIEKSPNPWDIYQPLLCAKNGSRPQGTTYQDTYRNLILDLAANIPLRPHGTLTPHHAREEELLGNGHPGEDGSKQGLRRPGT